MTNPPTTQPRPDVIERLVETLSEWLGPEVLLDADVDTLREIITAVLTPPPAASEPMVTISANSVRRIVDERTGVFVSTEDSFEAWEELRAALRAAPEDDDPNTPGGGNERFDPREWIDEETGVPFMDDDTPPPDASETVTISRNEPLWQHAIAYCRNIAKDSRYDEQKQAWNTEADRIAALRAAPEGVGDV